jgi:serine/threonine protein kinase
MDNVIVKSDFSESVLIDWGFACLVTDNMSPLVGARLYRSPEMLMGYTKYGTAGDIWAVGVIILDILSGHKLPWDASNAWLELVEMSKIFGGLMIQNYAKELNLTIKPDILEKFVDEPVKTFSLAEELKSPELVEVMMKLLTLDCRKRPTADEVLKAAYFQ